MKIFICGVGGQGVLLASLVLGRAAMKQNNVVMSEVHGMAQRGGVVVVTVAIGDYASPLIGDGEADVILGFEPSEVIRWAKKARSDTYIIMNTRAIVPPSVTLGHSQYPSVENFITELKEQASNVLVLDATALAEKAGSAIATNMAMIGGFAALPTSPVSIESLIATMEKSVPERFILVNKKAMQLGYNKVKELLSA